MKKLIFMVTLFVTLFFTKNVYAYTFPDDFNYEKAGTMIYSNMVSYANGNYWLSRYPYSGNDENYQGKYTQNFNFTASTYTIAFTRPSNSNYVDVIILSDIPFNCERYNTDGSLSSAVGPSGGAWNATLFTGQTAYNSDFTTFLDNTGKQWYFTTYGIAKSSLDEQPHPWPVYNSLDDWFAAMYNHNYDITNGGGIGDSSSTGDLPFLSYTLQRQTTVSLQGVLPYGQIKEIFEWNYNEKEPYASDPTSYSFDIMAYANFKEVTTNGVTETGFDRDNLSINSNNRVYLTQGGQSIAINNFSFLYDDIGESVYSHGAPIPWQRDSIGTIKCGYILGIRTCDVSRTQFSWWKLFIVQAGGQVYSTGKVMKPDGTVIDSGASNSNDNITGGGGAGYTTNNQTTAGGDTTGTVYDDTGKVDISTVISTLRSIVNQIGEIPSILSQLLTFLPAWFTSLLVLSFALFVTIGIVKIVVH